MKEIEIKTPDSRLVTAYSVNDLMQAELIKITLLDNGIRCEIDGEHQGGFTGALKIGILVRESDVAEAIKLIETHHLQ